SPLPVIGVPVALPVLDGLDSLLSIVQMPSGVPVATVGVGNARNAGLLAARILATGDDDLLAAYQDFQAVQAEQALAKGEAVRSRRPDPAAPGPTRPTSRPGQPADPANQPDPAAHGPKRPTTRPGP
ncbi:MAG: AIR carboxylase family protein, partial [Propionibacteriaceae bacterium]|nr:AIR carboxylase family protein [Propionibacteriaceae bacterium]